MNEPPNLDLVLVVPDKDTEQTFHGLLGRPEALGIRPIRYVIRVHPHKDPGCFKTGHELALPSLREATHALVVFDFAWEGRPSDDPAALEAAVEGRLRPAWGDRAHCVVVAPELEAWVWSDSPHVDDVLGWRGRQPELREWLRERGLWPAGTAKPPDPEAAFRQAVSAVRQPASSSLFRQLASRVSLLRCQDASFQRVVALLRGWFPPESARA